MLRSSMARRIHLWLPSLTIAALSACGGSATDFFSDRGSAGSAGSSRAGASSQAGSTSGSSSAGMPGSAGTLGAVGGSPSSGGDSASGGDGAGGQSSAGAPSGGNSSGGRAGASNAGGAAGRAGSGGSGATAGSAHAGSPGAAGSNGDPTCDDLHQQAVEQLEAARACNLALSSLQCTTTVKDTCDCPVPVRREDSTETKAYLATMKKVTAKGCTWACTQQACEAVTDAECKSSGSGTMGVCTIVNKGPGHGFP